MSYILDALKKAERERSIAKVPTIETVHDFRETSRMRLWLLIGGFLLGVVLILWFVLLSSRKGSSPEPVKLSASESSPVAALSPSLPAATEKAEPIHDRQSSLQQAGLRPLPTEDGNSLPDMAERKPVLIERHSMPPAPILGGPAPIENQSELSRPQSGAGAPKEGISESSPAKPASLREAVAAMIMTVHMFGDTKADRLVFINGRKYVEGDYVEGKYLVESIISDGVVLSYGGQRATLRAGSR
jgi:general secretion pathway protein B